jgi:FkbM family methyltransferase
VAGRGGIERPEDARVKSIRQRLKRLTESLTGYDITRIDSTFVFVDRRKRADAWFAYHILLQRLLDEARVDLVIDVGANEGQFARQLRTFYTGELISFEPVSTAFAKLAAAAATSPGWHVHQCALGSEPATRTMYVADDTAFSSLLHTNEYAMSRFRRAHSSREEPVVIRRLDEVLDESVSDLDRRHIFLKLDTQGFDVEVFRGLGHRIAQVMVLQSEVSLMSLYDGMPHWTDAIGLYERAGLHMAGMFPVTRDGGRVIEYDCLLIRPPL